MDRRASQPIGYVNRLSEPCLISPTEQPGLEMPVYASPPAPAVTVPEGCKTIYRHTKRGTDYELLGIGKMQAENWRDPDVDADYGSQLVDMREVAIYRSMDDGAFWVRPRGEFEDGRFAQLAAAPEPPATRSYEEGIEAKAVAPNPFAATRFVAIKAAGAHEPSYVLAETSPGNGPMIEINHHADYRIDDARAEWMASVLNAACFSGRLSPIDAEAKGFERGIEAAAVVADANMHSSVMPGHVGKNIAAAIRSLARG